MSLLQYYALAVLTTTTIATQVDLSANFSNAIVSDFAGIGGVRHGFDYMSEETYRGLNVSMRAVSLSRMCDARLRIARTWYGIDWAMPSW